MDMLSRTLVVLLLTFLLAGCAEDTGPSTAQDKEQAPPTSGFPDFLTIEADEVVVGCWGGIGWPASLMPEGITDVFTDEDAKAIFSEMLELTDNAVDLASFLPDGPDTEWRLLHVDGDEYVFGVGPWTVDGPRPAGHILTAENRADGWAWTGGGGCRLEPILQPGHAWVELHGEGLDRSSAEPMIELNEIDCTSGRDPVPFLHQPYVVETDESVTVYWTTTPPEGGQNCLGNPPVAQPLPLTEPLGDRRLLDGSTYPASPIASTVTP